MYPKKAVHRINIIGLLESCIIYVYAIAMDPCVFADFAQFNILNTCTGSIHGVIIYLRMLRLYELEACLLGLCISSIIYNL